jgi:hypothetical protein
VTIPDDPDDEGSRRLSLPGKGMAAHNRKTAPWVDDVRTLSTREVSRWTKRQIVECAGRKISDASALNRT